MTLYLPKLPDTTPVEAATQIAARLYRFGIAVVDFLRLMPTMEWKVIRADGGDYPLSVETLTRKPIGVLVTRAYLASDPSQATAEHGIAWHPSDDPAQPGIAITELSAVPGPAADDEYEFVLLVLGERE